MNQAVLLISIINAAVLVGMFYSSLQQAQKRVVKVEIKNRLQK